MATQVQVTQQPGRGLTLRPWMVVTGLCILYLMVVYIHYYGLNFDKRLSLVAGKPLSPAFPLIRYTGQALEFIFPTPSGSEGYDGQFTYYIAADPSTAVRRVHVPPYRYQRILQPALTRLLAVAQEAL